MVKPREKLTLGSREESEKMMLTFERVWLKKISHNDLHPFAGDLGELAHFWQIGEYRNTCEFRLLGQEFLGYSTAYVAACANEKN